MARNKKSGKLRGNRKNIIKNAKRIKENIEILKKFK